MCNGNDSTKQPGEKGSQPPPPPKEEPTSPVNEATSPPRNEAVQPDPQPSEVKAETPSPKKDETAVEKGSEPPQKDPIAQETASPAKKDDAAVETTTDSPQKDHPPSPTQETASPAKKDDAAVETTTDSAQKDHPPSPAQETASPVKKDDAAVETTADSPQKDHPPSPTQETASPAKKDDAPVETTTDSPQKDHPPSPAQETASPAKKDDAAVETATDSPQKDPPPPAVNEATSSSKTEGTAAKGNGESTQKDQPASELKGEPPAQTTETKPAARTGETTSATVKQAPLVRVRSSFYTWCKVHNVLPCDESLRWYLAPLRKAVEELSAFDKEATRREKVEIERCLAKLEPLTTVRWDGMLGEALQGIGIDVDEETQQIGARLASWSCALRDLPYESLAAAFPTRSSASEQARYASDSATVEPSPGEVLVLNRAVGQDGACLEKADSQQTGDPNDDAPGRLLCVDLLAGALLDEPLIDTRRLDDAWAAVIEPTELGTLRGWHADEHDMSLSATAAPGPYPRAASYTRHWAAWNDAVTCSSAHALCAPADKLVEEDGCTIESALGPKIETTSRKQGKVARLRVEYTCKGGNRAVFDLSSGLAYLTDHYGPNHGTQSWVPVALTPGYQKYLKELAAMASCRDQVAQLSTLSPTICFAPQEAKPGLPGFVSEKKKDTKDKKQPKPPLEGQPLRTLCYDIDRSANRLQPDECRTVLEQLGWITNGYAVNRAGKRRAGWSAAEAYQVLETDFDEAIGEHLTATAEILGKGKGELANLLRIVKELQKLAASAASTSEVPAPKRRVDLVAAYCLTNLLRFRLYQRWMDEEIRIRAKEGNKAKLARSTMDTDGTQGDHMLNDLWSGFGRFAALSGFNVPMPMALRRWLRSARRFRSFKWTDTATKRSPHPFARDFSADVGDPNSQLWSWAERACPLLAALAPEAVASEAEKASGRRDSKPKADAPRPKVSEKATQDGLMPEERKARLLSLEEAARAAYRRTAETAKDAKQRKDETEARAGLRQACRDAEFATDYLQQALALCPGAPTALEAVQRAELMYQLAEQIGRSMAAFVDAVEGSAAKTDWATRCREANGAVVSARDAADASRQAANMAAEGGDCAGEASAALEQATGAAVAAHEAVRALLDVVSSKGDGSGIKGWAAKAAAAAKAAREQVERIRPARDQARQAMADLMYCALHVLVSSSYDSGVHAMYSIDKTTSGGTFFYLQGGGSGESTPKLDELAPRYSAMLGACEEYAVQMAEIAAGRRRSYAAYMKDKSTLVRTTWGGAPQPSSGPAQRANAPAVIPPTPREIIGIQNEGNQCYRNAVLQLCAALDMGANFLPNGYQPAVMPVVQAFIDGLRPAARNANYILEESGNPATAYSSDFASTGQIRRSMSAARGWAAYSQQDALEALQWILDQCERPVDGNELNAFNLGFQKSDANAAVLEFQKVIPHKLAMLFNQKVIFTHPDFHGPFPIVFRESPRNMLEIPIRGAWAMTDLIAGELDYTDRTQADNRQNVEFKGKPYLDAQPFRRVWTLLSAPPQNLIIQLKRFVAQRIEVPATAPTDKKSPPTPSTPTPTDKKSVSPPSADKKVSTSEKGAEKEEEKGTQRPEARVVMNKSDTRVTGAARIAIEFGQTGTNYRLIAFVVHLGRTLEGGHYVAYVKAQGHWYKINDDVVTEDAADWQQMAEIGYLYLYEQGT